MTAEKNCISSAWGKLVKEAQHLFFHSGVKVLVQKVKSRNLNDSIDDGESGEFLLKSTIISTEHVQLQVVMIATESCVYCFKTEM